MNKEEALKEIERLQEVIKNIEDNENLEYWNGNNWISNDYVTRDAQEEYKINFREIKYCFGNYKYFISDTVNGYHVFWRKGR